MSLKFKDSKMNFNKNGDLVYFTFPALENYRFVKHMFSSRLGGVSEGIYSSLNLGFKRGDNVENVYQNYKIVCSNIGINQDDLVFGQLTHNDNIRFVTSIDKGKGIIKELDYTDIDGLITNELNVPLVMTFADCVPIYFLDPVNKVIAITHSGWRGTVKKIGEKVIFDMITSYNSNIDNIIVAIGPSIGGCCFEVGKEVYDEFCSMDCLPLDNWFSKAKTDKYFIDMWKVIESMFLKIGVKRQNITIADICTKCNSDIFFSHRATNGKRGSMAGIISLI